MAGVVPASSRRSALIGVCMWHGKKTGCDNGDGRASRAEIWAAFKDAGPALLMPVIIVGGIWSGFFTPTESAAVAVVYGLVVSLFLYSDITLARPAAAAAQGLPDQRHGDAGHRRHRCLAWLITVEQVAVQLADWVKLVAQRAVDVPAAGQHRRCCCSASSSSRCRRCC